MSARLQVHSTISIFTHKHFTEEPPQQGHMLLSGTGRNLEQSQAELKEGGNWKRRRVATPLLLLTHF